MRTDREIGLMIPLFATEEGDNWPEGVTASGILTEYLDGTRGREQEDLLSDLKIFCNRAFALLPFADINPAFGMYVAVAITIIWMLGDDALMVKIVKIEPNINGIIEKLVLIKETYEIDFSGVDEEE